MSPLNKTPTTRVDNQPKQPDTSISEGLGGGPSIPKWLLYVLNQSELSDSHRGCLQKLMFEIFLKAKYSVKVGGVVPDRRRMDLNTLRCGLFWRVFKELDDADRRKVL